MKRHRKFETWLADVRRQLVRPTFDGSISGLYSLGWDFSVVRDRVQARDIPVPDDIEQLLLAFAERTDSRGFAVAALNTLAASSTAS